MSQIAVPTSESLLREAKAFNLKKRLGQHFLVDADVLQGIADSLGANADDTVVEVGPGIGFLTRFLVTTGARIVAVDLDRESITELTALNLPNVEIEHGDFLNFNLSALEFYEKGKTSRAPATGPRLKIVGNVPYQITGLIIGHIFGEMDKPAPWLHLIDNVVLTVQREVAKRMVAKAGDDDYSKVSLLIAQYSEATLEKVIPPEAFYPPPQVTSAVIRFVPRKQPAVSVANPHLLKQVIDAGFRQRRKMLRNSLSFLRLPPGAVDEVFRKLNFDPQVRAERLSLAQFAMLADAFDRYLKEHANSQDAVSGEG